MAKLAGIPDGVVSRAKEVLKGIESGEIETGGRSAPAEERFEGEDGQLSLLPAGDSEVVRRLKELDVNTLTPIEALQTLYELTKLANAY